jgi:hypothetical protein
MAIAYVKELGKGTQTGTATTYVITLSATAAAGNLAIGRIGTGSTVTISSVTDSRGNTWTVDKTQGSGPSAHLVSTGQDVGTLQSGDTITITISGSIAAGTAIFDEFSGMDITSSRVDKTAGNSAGATTARDAGTTAATTQADELVVGAFAIAGDETSLTVGSGYSHFTSDYINDSATNSIAGEYQIVSATGTQNPTATAGANAAYRAVVATYKAAAGGAPPVIAIRALLGAGP